jgi:Domain of unknown function (DUF4258)
MQKNRLVLGIIGLAVVIAAVFVKKASVGSNGLNRNTSHLVYTKHARCRMACRMVSAAEVEDILKTGTINYAKTREQDQPCPSYALEGYSRQDHQHLRIVFAQCEDLTKVVTCIDLDNNYACSCK